MEIYAWTNSYLRDHLVNTWNTVLKYRKLDSIARSLAMKITFIDPEIDFREAYEVVALAHLLHDIGKATNKYQESIARAMANSNLKPSFKYHEIVSSCIVETSLDKCIVGSTKGRFLSAILVLTILNHHHAMRNIVVLGREERMAEALEILRNMVIYDELGDIVYDVIRDTGLGSELSLTIMDNVYRAINDINRGAGGKNLIKCFLNYIMTFSRRGYRSWITGLSRFNSLTLVLPYIVNSLSGLVSIADNITASLEREGKPRGISRALLKELVELG